jgi:WD40 repeat protein/serine/threonine protein kinase
MIVLMKCVAEAVMAKGVRGLAEMVPGGAYLYDVAHEALRRLRERRRADQLREEVLRAATATLEEVRQAAEQAVKEAAPNIPTEDRIALELYLTQVPGAVRQSLKRAEDPSGRSVPAAFALNTAADLLRQLPPRAAHFRPGDPLPGRPGWELVELLGTGGFGEVWLARNPALSALKGAVKFGLDPQARDRLLRHEGGLVNRVMEEGKHPNVVQLLDAHLAGESPWLMYEYVPGGDLTGLIHAWQNLPPDERVSRTVAALRTLAAAVGHFHRLRPPLVHRDLKPANILLAGVVRGEWSGVSEQPTSALTPHHSPLTTPQLKVADFGIGGVAAAASLAQEATRRSSAGVLVSQLLGSHTPLYASPQQQRGEPPDPRDDVHALGVIGFQMLTGKLDATLGADYAKTLRRLNVPDPLIELLGDCAAHDPENRPRDAAELAEKLANLPGPRDAAGSPVGRAVPDIAANTSGTARPPQADDGKTVVPCPRCGVPLKVARGEARPIRCGKCGHTFQPFPAPPAPPADSTTRPRPVARPVAAVRDPEPREPEPARGEKGRPRPRPEPPPRRGYPVLVLLGLIFLGLPALVIAGLYLARGGGGIATIFPSKPPHPLPERKLSFAGSGTRLYDLAFSPDGSRLIAADEEGTVRVWDPETGTEAPPIRTGVLRHRPAFGRDGTRLACLSSEDRVRLWDTTTGDWRALDGTIARPTAVGFSPDGWWVVAGGEAGAALAWDTRKADGKPVTLSSVGSDPAHPGGVESVTFDPMGRYLATLGKDGEAKLWVVERWAPRRTLTADTPLKALAFDPDRKRVLAGGADGSVRVWDTDTDADPQTWSTRHGPIARLVRSPREHHLVLIDVTGAASLRDANSLTEASETKLDQHTGRVNAGAFNPAGDLLATGGDDKAVLLWHMFFKKPRVRLLGHEAAVVAVGFSPDGRRLATGDAKGAVIVWSVPEIKPGLGEPDEVR